MPEHIQKKAIGETTEDQGSSGLPGAFPETPAAEEFRVAPIPASAGIGNPVQTRPGQPIPSSSLFTSKGINENVTLDKESYEKSGTAAAPQLPNPITPDEEREANGGMFGIPSQKENLIPESSLSMGTAAGAAATSAATDPSPAIRSAAPESTTAQLAGQVPLEGQRAPEVVKASQASASADPEASANPEALKSKDKVEDELTSKVPEQPATSESSTGSKAAGLAAGAAAGATAAVAGTAAYLSSTSAAQDAKSKLPVPAQETIDKLANATTNGSAEKPVQDATPIAPAVPDTVQESIAEAHQAPEAAANKEAVQDKSEAEAELLKKVTPDESTGQPAPTATASNVATAPAPLKSTEEPLSESKSATPAAVNAASAPAPLKSTEEPLSDSKPSITATAEKDLSAAAGANTAAPAPSTKKEAGLAAPASAPAKTAVTEEAPRPRIDSRDISPMSHPVSQPTVTSGVSSAPTPKKSEPAVASSSTPTPSSPVSTQGGEGSATGGDKKNKRRSFFGRLKDKLEHRKDKA